jgi:SHS2 domain-containing protein
VNGGFELLEHTADTGFRAWGETKADLYASAARALVSVALDSAAACPLESRAAVAEGSDDAELLINWLNEILWLVDGASFVPAGFDVTFAPGAVRAVVRGEARDDARHPPRMVVKAATFHQLRLWKEGERWTAEVYLDI